MRWSASLERSESSWEIVLPAAWSALTKNNTCLSNSVATCNSCRLTPGNLWLLLPNLELGGNRSDFCKPSAATTASISQPEKQCRRTRPSSASFKLNDGDRSGCAGHRALKALPAFCTPSSRVKIFSIGVDISHPLPCGCTQVIFNGVNVKQRDFFSSLKWRRKARASF